eukprot:1771313-Pleurochrysis_carterae.AAC.1
MGPPCRRADRKRTHVPLWAYGRRADMRTGCTRAGFCGHADVLRRGGTCTKVRPHRGRWALGAPADCARTSGLIAEMARERVDATTRRRARRSDRAGGGAGTARWQCTREAVAGQAAGRLRAPTVRPPRDTRSSGLRR